MSQATLPPQIAFDEAAAVKLVEDLSNARSCSGFEDEAIEVARAFCEPFATFETNSLRCGLLTPKNLALRIF